MNIPDISVQVGKLFILSYVKYTSCRIFKMKKQQQRQEQVSKTVRVWSYGNLRLQYNTNIKFKRFSPNNGFIH